MTTTFLWGGSKSLSELAVKFGWPSIIISIILTPVLLLWKQLVTHPFWLMDLKKHGNWDLKKFELSYPEQDNQWRKQLYESPTNPGRPIVGWNVYADVEGKKFFESFFGIIQVLDMEEKENDNKKEWTLKSNCLSWFPANVTIDFHEVDKHTVDLDLPIDGPNFYNPFLWISIAFVLASLTVAKYWGYYCFKKGLNATTKDVDENKKKHDDDTQKKAFRKCSAWIQKKLVRMTNYQIKTE